MAKLVGILTSGGDCPGLNAAIRGVGKAALGYYGMQVIGFRDGFRGFMENRTMELDGEMLSGILTQGGTILGTSRDKPHRMPVGGKVMDMTDVLLDNYRKHHLDALVCIGGGGTQKNALRLAEKGMNVFDYTGTTENEITGSTTPAATADTKWSGGELTGFIVLNESTVTPQYIAVESLGGATNLADLSNWPASTTCKVIRPFKYFLVAGGMTESSTYYPYKVRWSNSAVPGTLPSSWTATTSNDAGSVDLSANYGKIVDMLPLGDQLVIYRERGQT